MYGKLGRWQETVYVFFGIFYRKLLHNALFGRGF